MIFEVTGTSTRNKGAELMLLAIKQNLQKLDETIELAVDPSFGSWHERAKYDLLTKVEISKIGLSKIALGLMPKSFKSTLGVVRDADIEAILDASGFAFGDQHPLERSERFARQVERWSSQGKPVILLPQALGPFEQAQHRDAFRRIAAAANMIFAREPVSYAHAVKAAGSDHNIHMAPDFTGLVKPELRTISAESRRVCIVPNARMLEHAGSSDQAEAYLQLMADACGLATAFNLEPILLVHGQEDEPVAAAIRERAAQTTATEHIADPVEIKRYIGESHLLIGSRFHALVSALSQGVPALATSWSHKYEALFADYGFEQGVLSISCEREELSKKFDEVTGNSRAQVVKRLRENAAGLNDKTRDMWRSVSEELGISP